MRCERCGAEKFGLERLNVCADCLLEDLLQLVRVIDAAPGPPPLKTALKLEELADALELVVDGIRSAAGAGRG